MQMQLRLRPHMLHLTTILSNDKYHGPCDHYLKLYVGGCVTP